MKAKILISFIFLQFITTLNAQIKFSDLEHSFVPKSKINKSGVITSYNGKKYTGTIEYYENTVNEKTFYKFNNGILISHIRTRNDSVFYKSLYKAGCIETTESPYWRNNVEQSSKSFLSDNKIDSIYWFLKGELLSKIYYNYPEPNIKTESFYHCLNQPARLSYECIHYYENEQLSTPVPAIYPYALITKLTGTETTYNSITGIITQQNEYEIINFKSTKVSSIDFDENGKGIKKTPIKEPINVGEIDYDKLEFINQTMKINGVKKNHFLAVYRGITFTGSAIWKHPASITSYNFYRGKLKGFVEEKDLNNKIIYSCNFIDGKKEGMEFNQYSFDEGQIHFNKSYYTHGKLDSVYHYNNKILDSKVIYQYHTSELRQQIVYKANSGSLFIRMKIQQKITNIKPQESPLNENVFWEKASEGEYFPPPSDEE